MERRQLCGKIEVVVAHALAFLGVSALVIVTPGQDTALTIRNALWGGRRGGVFTACGVAAGQATWTLAASAGVATLLVASEPAFVALRALGVAYLVWLGLHSLRRAFARRASAEAERPVKTGPVSPGGAEQSRQPEDGGLLHQPAAAVRHRLRRDGRARPRLLRDDAGLAERLRARRRARRRRAAPLARACLAFASLTLCSRQSGSTVSLRGRTARCTRAKSARPSRTAHRPGQE